MWSLPQPIPGALRYMLVYALESRDGLFLIDAGWGQPDAFANLERSLEAVGARVADVRGVIFTHFHADHYALGPRIREESGAWLALHEVEAGLIAKAAPHERGSDEFLAWFVDLGVGAEEGQALIETLLRMRSYTPTAMPDRLLRDGDRLDLDGYDLEVVHTPGHSPGHVCLVDADRGIVFTGDCVLSYTTPNISIRPGSPEDPLDDYQRSLQRLCEFGDLLALPGHEERVPLRARATELLAHHDAELRAARKLVAEGHSTVREVAERMPWGRGSAWQRFAPVDRVLALGEAYAHLVSLERRGDLELVGSAPFRWRVRPERVDG